MAIAAGASCAIISAHARNQESAPLIHRTRKVLRVLLPACLLTLGGDRAASGSNLHDPVCAINRIDGAIATGGFLEITGFAVDPDRGAPVRKVEISLDERISGETSLAGLRPDVSTHFARPDYLWSGWSGSISLEGASPGKHRVVVIAIGGSGLQSSCGTRVIDVLAVPKTSETPAWRVAAGILLRTVAFLFWLALVGWAPARGLGSRPVLLAAPLLGLALFAFVSEAGGALGVRPLFSALALTALSLAALARVVRFRGTRRLSLFRTEIATLCCAIVFLAAGVIPLASHGEGAVLGDIDDAIRECSVADSISIYGWRVPSDVRGYLAALPALMRGAHVRPGGSYLLSALGEAFGARAHAVYSAAMLATGTLIVLATGLLATRVLRQFAAGRWIAPALVAVNSVLLATVYGQHFGNLLSVAMFTAFLSQTLLLIRSPLKRSVWPVALIAAAAFTLYPETTPVWGAAALLSLGTASAARRPRALRRLAVAALLAAALNPVGLVRAARFFRGTTTQSLEMSSPRHRLITGDTHYFPRLSVVMGLEAYREDAPAPVGTVRTILIPVAGVLVLVTALVGWARLAGRQRWLVAALVLPVFAALVWTFWLTFPYGFAKFLPLAVPVWLTAFVRLACAAADRPDRFRLPARSLLSYATLALVTGLSLPAARHVLVRAKRAIPSYDPDFRVLAGLASGIGRLAVIEIDEPLVARREWMRYFLGEYETQLAGASAGGDSNRDRPRYLLLDRRRADQVAKIAGPAAGDFALAPAASNLRPPP